jgi:hypothetical protein
MIVSLWTALHVLCWCDVLPTAGYIYKSCWDGSNGGAAGQQAVLGCACCLKSVHGMAGGLCQMLGITIVWHQEHPTSHAMHICGTSCASTAVTCGNRLCKLPNPSLPCMAVKDDWHGGHPPPSHSPCICWCQVWLVLHPVPWMTLMLNTHPPPFEGATC